MKDHRLIWKIAAAGLLLGMTCGISAAQEKPQGSDKPPVVTVPQARSAGAEYPMALRVIAGKSLVIDSPEPLKRVSVSAPSVASALIISPTQVLVHGVTPGTVTMILWDDQDGTRSFDL